MATTTERDAQIMDEAEKQRKHELKLEEIRAAMLQEQARQELRRAESRHELIGYFGVGAAIVTALAIIIGGFLYGVMDGRKDQQQREQQQNQVAETCIRAGNIWLDGDCIPAGKN